MDLTPHIEMLTGFAKSHLNGSEERDRLIRLKIDHTLHVLENAEAIIREEGINGTMAETCLLAALYHDIGRFPQIKRYGSFNDKISVNHGRLGVLTLRELDLPGELPEDVQRSLRVAVGQHNLKNISETLPEHLSIPARVVRDADKMDIYRVMVAHFAGDNPDPTVTHGFEDIPGKYTMRLFNQIMDGQLGDYSLMRYANDFKLLLISWLPTLYFSTTLRLLVDRDLVNGIFALLPNDDNIRALKIQTDTLICYNSD